MHKEKLHILVIEPGKKPEVKDIEPGLKSLQNAVGGDIEAIYPFEENAAVLCNESGKLDGLDLNRALRYNGKVYDIIAGTMLILGVDGENFSSLSDDLIDKYSKEFASPEMFLSIGGEIVVLPID